MPNNPSSADEDVARLRLKLRHIDLSTLVEHDIVIWDHDENVVKKGPQFDSMTPISALPDDDRALPD
jgi:hypothetical protein